jgi:hypothetical protein
LPAIPEFASAPVEAEPLPQPATAAIEAIEASEATEASDPPHAVPASESESPAAEQRDTPISTAAPTQLEAVESPPAASVEVHKPVADELGDPFMDDPLPGQGAVPHERAAER